MAVIGIIDIAIKADTGPFVASVGKAADTVQGFGKSIATTAGAGLASFGDKLSGLGSTAKSAIGDLGAIAGQLGKIGLAAGGAAVAGLAAFAMSSLDAIDKTGELAERLGVSGGAFAAFEHAVKLSGGPVEALPELLGRLNGQLGLAATQITPVSLALKRLGLDAKTLSDAGPIEAIKQIAGKLETVAAPGDRAALTMQIFGEQGSKLAGTLKLGAGGIAALEEEAKRLGIALKDVDYAKANAAKDALDRAGTVIGGIGAQLAVNLAPYIEAAATKFTELATAGGGASVTVKKGLDQVGAALGFVADTVQVLKIAWLGTQVSITAGLAGAITNLNAFGKTLEGIINMIPGMEVSFTQTLGAIGEDLTKLAGEQGAGLKAAMEEPAASTKLKTFLDDIAKSADKSAAALQGAGNATRDLGGAMSDTSFKVAQLETKLLDQVATFGQSSAEVEVYKLKQQGASAADLARIEPLTKQLKALEEGKEAAKKATDEGKKLFEDTLTPMEKFKIESEKIRDLFAGGFIDKTAMERGVEKLTKESGLEDTGKRAGAFEAGSKEARSSILAFRSQGASSVDQATKDTAEATKKTATSSNELLVLFRQEFAKAASIAGNLVGIGA